MIRHLSSVNLLELVCLLQVLQNVEYQGVIIIIIIVVAKIDFSNAFNSLRRDLMLRSVALSC